MVILAVKAMAPALGANALFGSTTHQYDLVERDLSDVPRTYCRGARLTPQRKAEILTVITLEATQMPLGAAPSAA